MVATQCRCGTDLQVVADGKATICPHCDRGCKDRTTCAKCHRYDRHCFVCRELAPTIAAARACERQHRE